MSENQFNIDEEVELIRDVFGQLADADPDELSRLLKVKESHPIKKEKDDDDDKKGQIILVQEVLKRFSRVSEKNLRHFIESSDTSTMRQLNFSPETPPDDDDDKKGGGESNDGKVDGEKKG